MNKLNRRIGPFGARQMKGIHPSKVAGWRLHTLDRCLLLPLFSEKYIGPKWPHPLRKVHLRLQK